jgi:single-stranded-DNA-specific exonuclease
MPAPQDPFGKDLDVMTFTARWHIASPTPSEQIARFSHLPPVLIQLLANRGIVEPDAVASFLSAPWDVPISDPWHLPDMRKAVTRILKALDGGEEIVVYGDYDADGICAATIMAETLAALGGRGRGRIKIPKRSQEGYGLNCKDLESLARGGCSLVITVDCGIRSLREVAYAQNELGMDVVVTDHHGPSTELPAAVAVVNPKREESEAPFRDFSGVGLAYKLAQALAESRPSDFQPEDLLDLVAVGTVADLVPLVGENRTLVQRGLELLNEPRRPGIRVLMDEAGVGRGEVDASTIGYVLGPRLNAAGRIADASWSVRLLMSEGEDARVWAHRLEEVNRQRQQITKDAVERARAEIREAPEEDRLIFIVGEDYPAGVVGLVASRLVEEFQRPAVVAERGTQTTRGSARSIPGFHFTRALDECGELMVKHGGHAMAAGFTVTNENLETLGIRLKEIARSRVRDEDMIPILSIDAEIELADIVKQEIPQALKLLQPFGESNSEPVFASRGVVVRDARPVGRDEAHLKLVVSAQNTLWDAIAFRQAGRLNELNIGERIDVAYNVSQNRWNGQERLQLRICDLKSCPATS